MKIKKISLGLLSLALVLVMVVGAFSMFTVETAADSIDATKLVRGVSFDTYDGAQNKKNTKDTNNVHNYVYSQTGMYITTQTGKSVIKDMDGNGVKTIEMVKDANGGHKLRINSMVYVNAQTAGDNNVNVEKLAKNKSFLDLFVSPDGIDKFDFEFDVIIEENPKGTSDNAESPVSVYRGASVFSLGKWNHMFKATATGVSLYEKTGEGDKIKAIEGSAQTGVGYIYSDAKTYSFTAEDEIGKLNGAYVTDSSGGMMPAEGDGVKVPYKIGEPIKIKLSIDKKMDASGNETNKYNCVSVYANGVYLGKRQIDLSTKAWGARLGDNSYVKFSMDNLKVTLNECSDYTHDTKWGVETKLVDDAATNTYKVIEYCEICGKTLGDASFFDKVMLNTDKYDDPSKTNRLQSSQFKSTEAKVMYYLRMDANTISKTAKNNYWLIFDYSITGNPKNYTGEQSFTDSKGDPTQVSKGWNIINNMSTSGVYTSLLRVIPDGWEVGNCTLVSGTKYKQGTTDGKYQVVAANANAGGYNTYRTGEVVCEIAKNEKVNFALNVNPVTGEYDVYVNGTYAGSGLSAVKEDHASHATSTNDFPAFRMFENMDLGTSKIENIAVYSDKHEHTNAYSDEVGVHVGYDTLSSTYACFCGEDEPDGYVNDVIVKTNDVYYGKATIEGLPTEGEYWVATDYNVRTADAFTADSKVLAIGSYTVKVSDLGELKAPNTYSVAAKVKYTAEKTADIELYLDGKYIGVTKDVTLDGATALALGDTETTDVRFNYTKIVKLGNGKLEKVTYNKATDATVKPCAHVEKDGSYKFIPVTGTSYKVEKDKNTIAGINKLVYSYACSKCGERVYLEQGDVLGLTAYNKDIVLDETGSMSAPINSAKYLYVDPKEVGYGSGAYWISFDFHANFTEKQIKVIVDRQSGGTSIFSIKAPWLDPSVLDNPEYSSIAADKGYKGSHSDPTQYIQFMRAYGALDENGGFRDDAIGIEFYQTTGSDPASPKFIMENGETYNIAIFVDPREDGVHYKTYLDGVLMEERHDVGALIAAVYDANRADMDIIEKAIAENKTDNGKRRFSFRFLDRDCGTFTVSNFSLVRAVSEEHTHTDAWCTDEDKIVVVTPDTVESYDVCYCGEKLFTGQVSKIFLNNFPTIYERALNDEDAPTEDYWYITELNLRDEKATEADIKLNGVLVEYNGEAILVGGEDTGVKITKPNTYVIAIEMKNDLYRVYIDGKMVASGEGENLLAPDSCIQMYAGESVRFNKNKLVGLGETKTDMTIKYWTSEYARPCAHKFTEEFISGIVRDSEGNLIYTSKCTECGEIVYNVGIKDSYAEGDISVKKGGSEVDFTNGYKVIPSNDNSTPVYLSESFIGKDKAPYQLEFTIKLDKIPTNIAGTYDWEKGYITGGLANRAKANDGTVYDTGRNLINSHNLKISNGKYSALVRQYPAYNGDGDVWYDRIELRSGNYGPSSVYLDTMYLGDTKTVSLYVTPATQTVDIYIDGKYVATRDEGGYDATYPNFRMNDGFGCEFTMTDFRVMRSDGVSHTHSDKYLDETELAKVKFGVIKTELGNKVEYSYDCYCDDRVTYAIDSVIAEKLAPYYGCSSVEKVGEFALNTDGVAFVSGFAVRNLPTEKVDLFKLGDASLIEIDENGALYLGGKNVANVEDNSEYHTLAVLKLTGYDNSYIVFIDGMAVGTTEIAGDSVAVTVGAENGEYHFDEMAVVELAERESGIAYKLDTTTHADHKFDPTKAKLVFDADKTTITVNYVCTECDRPTQDGIVKDLATVLPLLNNKEACESVLVDGVSKIISDAEAKNFWVSFDIAVSKQCTSEMLPLLNVGGATVIEINKNGAIFANGEVIGSLNSKYTNITVGTCTVDNAVVLCVYVDGKYCATVTPAGEATDNIVLGNTETVINFKNAKFVELGNDGVLAIGAYDCGEGSHVFDKSKATVSYIDPSVFEYAYSCRFCGFEIVERPTAKYRYDGLFDAMGGMGIGYIHGEGPVITPNVYWIVSDVNLRASSFDAFSGYVNLIGEGGNSVVLVNSIGNLILGDGTKLGIKLTGKSTRNIAVLCEVGEEGARTYTVYVDGKFAGQTTGDIVYTYDASDMSDCEVYMQFGSFTGELEDVKFYNNKMFTSIPTDEVIEFTFGADEYSIPCRHKYDSETSGTKVFFVDELTTMYVCAECGERVYSVADTSIYDADINSSFAPNANGEIVFSGTKTLNGTEATMGPDADPYWISFDLYAEKLNVDNVSKKDNNNKGGRNFLNFGSEYKSPLRLFAVKDEFGNFLPDMLDVRENNTINAKKLFTMVKGGTYHLDLYVDPANYSVDIYLDGEFLTSRGGATHATNFTIRFLDGDWGTFRISNFKMVADAHVHTSEYSERLGGSDFLVYGETTLTHTYTCYCGAELVDGIEKIHQNAIKDVTTSTEKAIAEGVVINSNTYWLSAKVFPGDGASNIYTYNGEYLVDITDGVYRIGGEATEIAPSVGAYDIISVKVYPNDDKYLVYIDGKYVGTGRNIDFTPGEEFNIKLGGGGVQNTFKTIKLVTLANEATNAVAGCGDHSFNYNSVYATVDANGVKYKCLICDAEIRNVAIDNNAKFEKLNKVTTKNEGGPVYELTNYRDTIFAADLNTKFYVTFDITPIASGSNNAFTNKNQDRNSLITWINTPNLGDNTVTDYNQRLLNAWKTNDDKVADITFRVNGTESVGKASPTGSITQLVQGTKYTFIYEVDSATGIYQVYINGEYSGQGGAIKFDAGTEKDGKPLRYFFRYNNNAGNYEYENLRIFKVASSTDAPVVETPTPTVHVHKPASNKGGDITYVDGKLNHSFTCSSCGEEVVLTKSVSLLDTDKADLLDRNGLNNLYVGTEIANNNAPYWLSFDFTVDSVGVMGLASAAGSGSSTSYPSAGRSFVSIESPTSNSRVHLLRGFAHTYKDGEGYEKYTIDYKDEFGNYKSSKSFAVGVIDLRVCGNSGSKLIKTVKVGETINLAYYIVPTTGEIWIYLDGQFVTTHKAGTSGGKCACSPYTGANFAEANTIRFMDGAYGMYDFANIQVTRLTDSCLHENPASCTTGATYVCDCGMELATAHNYTVDRDLTGMWNVYTCADCDSYYMVFADASVLDDVDVVFANDKALLAYLVKNYPPMIIK